MRTQMEKAEALRALHARPGAFIIPNPWDAGTAKLLAAMGFEALATTSLGLANTLGSATVSLDAIIENCRMIADATDLPVNADLENCGADDPNTAAKAIARAAEAGCVGGSIEDSTGNPRAPIYDFQLAVERVQAAVEANDLSGLEGTAALDRARATSPLRIEGVPERMIAWMDSFNVGIAGLLLLGSLCFRGNTMSVLVLVGAGVAIAGHHLGIRTVEPVSNYHIALLLGLVIVLVGYRCGR